MNPEKQQEYQERMGSPEMEYLQYLMEHPELANPPEDYGTPITNEDNLK